MIRYPTSTLFQQTIVAPLNSLVAQNPCCEEWISFLNQANTVYSSLSTGALQNLANIAGCLANVFDYLYSSTQQSIYSSQYLMTLSISANQTSSSASLTAQLSTGTLNISLTQAAQNALTTLQSWDPVQGYQTPTNPSQLAYIVLQGVSFS